MEEEKISIVIPTYNRKEIISKCLQSLSGLSYVNYEIIVIDDASADSTVEYIKSQFHKVIIIRNDGRRGPAYCKNQGLLKSTGAFIWFLDSDSIILYRDCLLNMINIYKQESIVGCIGGELVHEQGQYLVRVNGRKMIFNEDTKHHFNMLKVRSLTTANLFTRKDLLLKIGGFDNDYFYMSEDTDICFRVRKSGYNIILDYRTLVLHQYEKDFRKSNFYLLFRNEIRCILKNCSIAEGLLKEPLRIFLNFAYMLKYKTKSSLSLSDTIHIVSVSKKGQSNCRILFYLAIKIMLSFILAYSWNILFLFKTICIDRKTDYLKKVFIR